MIFVKQSLHSWVQSSHLETLIFQRNFQLNPFFVKKCQIQAVFCKTLVVTCVCLSKSKHFSVIFMRQHNTVFFCVNNENPPSYQIFLKYLKMIKARNLKINLEIYSVYTWEYYGRRSVASSRYLVYARYDDWFGCMIILHKSFKNIYCTYSIKLYNKETAN